MKLPYNRDLPEAIEFVTALIVRGDDLVARLISQGPEATDAFARSRGPVQVAHFEDERQPAMSQLFCYDLAMLCYRVLMHHEDATGEDPRSVLTRIALENAEAESPE
jgi:hypothetical protein